MRVYVRDREALPEAWKDLVAYATERGAEVVEDESLPPNRLVLERPGEPTMTWDMDSGEHGVAFPFSLN